VAHVIQRHGGVPLRNSDAPLVVREKFEVRLDAVPGGYAFGVPAKRQRRRRHHMKAFANRRVAMCDRTLKRLGNIVGVDVMQRLQTEVREANRPAVREIVEYARIEIASGVNRRPAAPD